MSLSESQISTSTNYGTDLSGPMAYKDHFPTTWHPQQRINAIYPGQFVIWRVLEKMDQCKVKTKRNKPFCHHLLSIHSVTPDRGSLRCHGGTISNQRTSRLSYSAYRVNVGMRFFNVVIPRLSLPSSSSSALSCFQEDGEVVMMCYKADVL